MPHPQPDDPQLTPASSALSDRGRAILAFAGSWWKFEGAKESAIREQFDMSRTTYYATLNRILDDPAAEAVDPLLVRRLRRQRTARARSRSARRLPR
jgi:hypothetical protein